MSPIICVGLCLLIICNEAYGSNLDALTENFFENLKEDPKLKQFEFNEVSKSFVDRQVENYVALITKNDQKLNKKKRSLEEKLTKDLLGTFLLDTVRPWGNVPTSFPEDIALFQQKGKIYAVTLNSEDIKKTSDHLSIFAYNTTSNFFSFVTQYPITEGIKLATLSVDNSTTLIVVAENDTSKIEFSKKSGVFTFTDSVLEKIQTLDMNYATDVALWRIHEDVYMSVAHFLNDQNDNTIIYETESPIYKWKGKHFDLVQSLNTSGATKVHPFAIGHSQFLAVANLRNQKASKTYSVVYKFNHHSEQYEVYQKISTKGCTDIAFFICTSNDMTPSRRTDSFLIVANFFDQDSIVYKFVDDYFIPFQSFRLDGIHQWLPLVSLDNQVTLLAASRFGGLKSWQYDGWSFIEVFPKGLNALGKVPKSLRSFYWDDKQILVVADKEHRGDTANLFTLDYIHENALKSIHDEVMSWCLKASEKIRTLDEDETLSRRSDIPIEDADSFVNSEMNEMLLQISAMNQRMSHIERGLNGLMRLSPTQFLASDMSADEVIFENDLVLHEGLEVKEWNNVNVMELLENSLNITKGFELMTALELDSVSLGSFKRMPERINGRNSRDLVHLNDDLTLSKLTVNGAVEIPTLQVNGAVNGASAVNTKHLISTEGNQNIDSDLVELDEIEVDRIFTKTLNGLELSDLSREVEKIEIAHLKILKVSKVTVGGYINDVDIPTLDKHALKTSGNQTISAKYTFNRLKAHNLNAEVISNKRLSDMVRIDEGDHSLDSSFIFSHDLSVNNLTISNALNELKVDQDTGRLEVLLKYSEDIQEVTGVKVFSSLEILNPINLNGNIKSLELERMNPVINISDDLIVEGDYTVHGLVKIEDLAKVDDIRTSTRDLSVVKMRELGVTLHSTTVKPNLKFIQKLELDQVNVSGDINGYPVDEFVVTNGNDVQIINGLKIFETDFVVINGSTEALKINQVDMKDLSSNVLLVSGDQMVHAKHTIKKVIIDRISSKVTRFGSHLWNETITTSTNQDIVGTVVIKGNLTTKTANTQNLIVNGTVQEENFELMINDTVRTSNSSKIEGIKTFTNLKIKNLSVDTGFSLAEIDENALRLKATLDIFEPIAIDKITFTETCNNVKIDAFGTAEKDEEGFNIIKGNHDFNVITAQVGVELIKINHVTVGELIEDTVKIDEEFEFDSAEFESDVISEAPVELGGQIELVDFDNTVLSFTDLEQVTYDEKTFTNLTVNGSIHLDGSLSDFNMSKLCQFRAEDFDKLTVVGDAYFVKGPNVAKINSISIEDVIENGWFKNRDTVLTGYSAFDLVSFEDDVSVAGFIDNVSLTVLAANYFSKSRDQEVAAILTVDDVVTFSGHLSVPEIVQNGDANGINVEEFLGTALLDDYNQTFESLAFIEDCRILELEGEFLVNNLNLEEEVMRYDKVNMVTGTKTFDDVTIEHLLINNNAEIQNTDILAFLRNAILRSGSYNITGLKNIENGVFLKGLQLEGSLNDRIAIFDKENVMIKNLAQEVSGKKVFITDRLDPLVLKALKLKKGLNGIDVTDLFNNQVYKDKDAVFLSRVNFDHNLTVKSLSFNDQFQGINVTELMRNVTSFGALNNLLGNYHKLSQVSVKMERYLKDQAHYLHHYKVIQEIFEVSNSVKIETIKGDRIANLKRLDDNNTRIDFLAWHTVLEEFRSEEYTSYPSGCISYFNQALGRYLYIEQNDDNFGKFLSLDGFEVFTKIITNKTRSTTSFVLPEKQVFCTLFIYYEASYPRIFCENNSYVDLLQTVELLGATKATSITMDDSLHLVLIVKDVAVHTCLYRYNKNTNSFEESQKIYEPQPESAAAIAFNRHTNLIAIASGLLENSMYSGRVSIWKFDSSSGQFAIFQVVELNAPVQVEFSLLTSGELVLYVLTNSPTSPLIVYKYEGASGFKKEIVASGLGKIQYFYQINNGNFLIGQNHQQVDVIRAVFKGERIVVHDDEM